MDLSHWDLVTPNMKPPPPSEALNDISIIWLFLFEFCQQKCESTMSDPIWGCRSVLMLKPYSVFIPQRHSCRNGLIYGRRRGHLSCWNQWMLCICRWWSPILSSFDKGSHICVLKLEESVPILKWTIFHAGTYLWIGCSVYVYRSVVLQYELVYLPCWNLFIKALCAHCETLFSSQSSLQRKINIYRCFWFTQNILMESI